MKVALHDSDKTRFPNLALMKLSARHKAAGDDVVWFDPILSVGVDRVYSSKVFSFTPTSGYLPHETIRGGTGYGLNGQLSESTEHTCPDYSLYGAGYSMGFTTRGCPRKCEWCFVPAKEGGIRPHADVGEFLRHENVVLMDNNILAHEHGIRQLEGLSAKGVRVDVNQGMDARLVDDSVAKMLSRVRWWKPIRLSCDTSAAIPATLKAIERLRWHNATPRRYFVYVLVREIEDALIRIKVLKGVDVDVFAQPYRGTNGGEPTQDQKRLARWVNHKAEFKSRTWQEYVGSEHARDRKDGE